MVNVGHALDRCMQDGEELTTDELVRRLGIAITPRGKVVDAAAAKGVLHGLAYGFAAIRSNTGGKTWVRTGRNDGPRNLLITGESGLPRREVQVAIIDENGKEVMVDRSKSAARIAEVQAHRRRVRVEQIRRDLAEV